MKKRYLVQGLGLFVLTAFSLPAAWTASSQDAPPRKVEITAKRFSFQPAEITLKKGEPVVLVFKSEDVTHGIKFQEFNIDETEIKKDASKEINLTPDQVGDFIGHCSHFCGEGHGSMMLTVHVTE
jgi:cytochrome c oxidase subunit II